MGKAWRPELSTKEQVLSFYENSDIVKFRVYAGTEPHVNALRYEYEGTNKNDALHELSNACDAILANPVNYNTYVLQLVKSDKIIKESAHKLAKPIPDAINITFQLNYPNNIQQIGNTHNIQPYTPQPAPIPNELTEALKMIAQTQSAILERLAAQEEEEEEEEEAPKQGIAGLLENPKIQDALADKICMMLGLGTATSKPIAVAGQPGEQDNRIKQAIDILKLHDEEIGNDLLRLAAIATNDKNQFNMLIGMLRNMVQLQN